MPNKINNFLEPGNTSHRKKNIKIQKYLKIVSIALFAIIAIFGLVYLLYSKPIRKVYSAGITGKNAFLTAQGKLTTEDFDGAEASLQVAISNFNIAQQEFKKLRWMSIIPWLGTQIKAVDNVIAAGITTGQSVETINSFAIETLKPIKKNNDISLDSLTPEETHQLLQNIYESKPKLENAKATIDQSVSYINKIPKKGIIKQLKKIIQPLQEKIPQLQKGIDEGISASQIIPSIAGYPSNKTYLFLLQNNTELRPTGGFIGTYGILKVKDGDIQSFNTDNVYNLDTPAEAWLSIDPPTPLTRYNKVFKWFFRDSNWSPDFPTTAQKAEWFYQQERGPEKQIDGIIAVTPTFIQSLLGITGDIKVNGLTFTSENLVDTLQYQVEQGFLRQGISENDRKEIIGVLSKKILDSVLALPKSKWSGLWQIFSKDITEKQIVMYLKDDYIQQLILKENWGGAIQPSSYDYVSVIDANLASLKTDPGVHRSYSYTVRRDGDNLIADLSITYKNDGVITWKTTRYRTYTRVYVPKGSTLLTSSGMMIDCKIDQPGSVEASEELDKTVFGTFICIEPKEEKTLTFKYKLPNSLTNELNKKDDYQLLFQKQPGTAEYPLTIQINLKRKPKTVSGIDNNQIKADNTILLNTSLSQDRNTIINF